jgi:hypothetical protein
MTNKKVILGMPKVLKSSGYGAKLIADCGLKFQTYRAFKIRNPQSAIRNLNYSNTPKFIEIKSFHDGCITFFWLVDSFFYDALLTC